jgi:hypothetical protein
MSWQQWVLVVWLALESVLTICKVGKPRPLWTPGAAAFQVMVFAAFIALVVTA